MRLSSRLQEYIERRGQTSLCELSDRFGISLERCREELSWIGPVSVERDGSVRIGESDTIWGEMFT
jgi:predicted metalloprotease with PDZ domain